MNHALLRTGLRLFACLAVAGFLAFACAENEPATADDAAVSAAGKAKIVYYALPG